MSGLAATVSVVIPVHNGAEHIVEQLQAVATSLAPLSGAEIVVVDNRSTDGTSTIVSNWAASLAGVVEVRLVCADERSGEPHARNVGWRSTASTFILFCDADDAVSPAWARALVEALGEREYVTGPLETRLLNSPWVENVRGQSLFRAMPRLHGVIPFAHGANMAFRRTTLEDLGGFDETFLIGCDIEIALRAWRKNIALTWAPEALVHYRLRSTPSGVYQQARGYGRCRHRLDAKVPELGPSRRSRLVHRVKLGAWLLRHLPEVRNRGGQLKWLWVAGQLAGEVGGGR